MITTTVFSFSSMANSFYLMGTAAIPWFLVTAICFFIPYAFIIAEYSYRYKEQTAGIYSWLKDTLPLPIVYIATFIWYSSYTIWLVSLSLKLWIPFSIFLFGQDLTQRAAISVTISNRFLLGLLSILAIFLLTWFVSRGFQKLTTFIILGGRLILVLFIVALTSHLILFFKLPDNSFNPLTTHSLLNSPNPAYQSSLGNLSFFIFGITAYGGLDTIASLVDQLSQRKNHFAKAVSVSSFLVAGLYLSGVLLWSTTTSWSDIFTHSHVNLGNAMYVLMENLGVRLGETLGFPPKQAFRLGQLFLRLNGLTLFITYLGLLSTISYSPLKTLVFALSKQTIIPKKAYWIQASVVSLFILLISSGEQGINQLYNQLTLMTSVSRSLPYLFLAWNFYYFRQNQAEFIFLKNKKLALLASFSVTVSVLFALGFTLLTPFLAGDYETFFFLLLGPCVFSVVGLGVWGLRKIKPL